jgi:hypothetical protein
LFDDDFGIRINTKPPGVDRDGVLQGLEQGQRTRQRCCPDA